VYDVSAYFNSGNNFLGDTVTFILSNFYGKDATKQWEQLIRDEGKEVADRYLNCMNNMFYIGTVDRRSDFRCQFSNYILLASTIVLVLVIGVKFLAALQFGSNKEPEEHDKFVICQVPCYTEGPESLAKTLESLALLRYDDKRKLLFIVCDGMIIGSGNDRPTPRIVLDILGVDATVDPEPLSFQSLGEGDKQHNMGKVYSGLYEVQGRNVPFVVVVKVGKPTERARPGNRGKRDSQMILMRFLNRVHFNGEMNPLELEMYHHMKNIIGVNPSFYEYILMVDADTEVFSDALNKMVSCMIHDSRIMGLCGETLIANEKDSWITMIQVYEYFISHHLSKAFESLFGSVTCLPGCFCMYRVRTPTKNIPLLISPNVIHDYSENEVDTLHMKNLLHLGEDRYLTTLMMKHFPNMKLTFTQDAQCKTNVPDRWAVLLSQRRRWINSTIHNLAELLTLPQLCGFCCFSMRFVVFLDLFSTVVQPAGILYIGYLIYSVVENESNFPLISIVMIALIYGLQVIIFLLKRQWAQIGWMLIVSIPHYTSLVTITYMK
jgi:chitin synthase